MYEEALKPFQRDQITVAGPYVTLQPNMALSMALAINELGTNALKYGALVSADGRVAVKWSTNDQNGEPQFIWSWSEEGGPDLPKGRHPSEFTVWSRPCRASNAGSFECIAVECGTVRPLAVNR